MTRVYIDPMNGGDVGGIARVVEGQRAHLAKYDIEVVDDPAAAEVLAAHVTFPDIWKTRFSRIPLVAHNHGLYWTPEYSWPPWAMKANELVMDLVRIADVVTAPSEWVRNSLVRHSMRDVRTIYHGIDCDEWPLVTDHAGYVLWNKSRPDPVCDPGPVLQLAAAMPDVPFVTTFTAQTMDPRPAAHPGAPNVTVTGATSFADAKEFVQHAGVYLCTVRETFGIGTLEALASGVPVVGWRWGGQAEFIEHGVDGWLCEPGDIAGLEAGVRWALENREAIAPRARAKALTFGWDGIAEQYAEIYHELAERAQLEREAPRSSVIVTAYELEQWLPATLDSVLAQTDPDWECIVVDDASPDRCGAIAEEYAARDPRFRVIHNATNRYQAGARNVGIAAARGRYIFPLDADDMLTPLAIQTLAGALDADRSLHIAYGGVFFIHPDGEPMDYRVANQDPGHSGWPLPFVLEHQATDYGANLLPYSSAFRRTVWERTGGYRERWRTGDDPDFWLRAASYGFVPKMVTQVDMLTYRVRDNSMSRRDSRRQWPVWFPWTRRHDTLPGAGLRAEGVALKPILDPEVAVIIPVGPDHVRYLMDAIDSVDAQTFRAWECIVINDSGAQLPPLPSWVQVVERELICGEHATGPVPIRCECAWDLAVNMVPMKFGGVAAARNAGVKASHAALFLPLDADDYLQPGALELFMQAYRKTDGSTILYCDFFEDPHMPGLFQIWQTPDYRPEMLLQGVRWAVTCLTPRAVWDECGGYDETIPVWEDWAFHMRAAELGICMGRVAAPLFTYRKHTGARRADNLHRRDEGEREMRARFGKYWEGEELMCMTCSAGRATSFVPTADGGSEGGPPPIVDGASMMDFIGEGTGGFNVVARPSQTRYWFDKGSPVYVLNQDVPFFLEQWPDRYAIVSGAGTAVASDTLVGLEPALVAEGPPPRADEAAQPVEPGVREGLEAPPVPPELPAPFGAVGTGAQDVGPAVAVAERPGSPADVSPAPLTEDVLQLYTRADLNAYASRLGIREPSAYPNKARLIEAILDPKLRDE